LSFAAMFGVVWFSLIKWTSRRINVPADLEALFERHRSAILVLWHGELFMMPFLIADRKRINILMTLHRDGEILSRGVNFLGMKTIRGSGGEGREFVRKRAVRAFADLLRALRRGESVMMTADVPKVSRVAGLGPVTLAKHSQCPIIPVAMATTHFVRFKNWDRTCFNLPFGRVAAVCGEPIFVAKDADDGMLESVRLQIETTLNQLTERAFDIAGAGADAAKPR
jgi:hypothetical protein